MRRVAKIMQKGTKAVVYVHREPGPYSLERRLQINHSFRVKTTLYPHLCFQVFHPDMDFTAGTAAGWQEVNTIPNNYEK